MKSRNKIVSVKLLRFTFPLTLVTVEKWDGDQKQNVATSVVASKTGTRSATSQLLPPKQFWCFEVVIKYQRD